MSVGLEPNLVELSQAMSRPGLTGQHKSSLYTLVEDEHSSLLCPVISDKEKCIIKMIVNIIITFIIITYVGTK
jgi:hypothetical protein